MVLKTRMVGLPDERAVTPFYFSAPNVIAIFRQGPPDGGVECRGYEKTRDFRPIFRSMSEIIQDRAIVTMEH